MRCSVIEKCRHYELSSRRIDELGKFDGFDDLNSMIAILVRDRDRRLMKKKLFGCYRSWLNVIPIPDILSEGLTRSY